MRKHRIAIAILAMPLFLALAPAIGAQQADRPARVFLAVAPGPGADAAYGPVLSDALAVSLTRSRMRPTAFATAAEARSAAKEGGADYLVFGTWSNTTESLELTIAAWLPAGKAQLASGTASGRIGLALDDVVADALVEVLPAMKARFPGDNPTKETGTSGATATTVVAIGPSGSDLAVVEPPPRWRLVELAIGGAPLVTTGTVADYAKIGAFAGLDFDFRFPVGQGVLAAGLQAGAGWFRAAGVGVADIFVAPVGPDLHWTIVDEANPAVSLHVAVGPAVLVAVTSWADPRIKISPFVAGGLMVDMSFSPAIGLRIEADYVVVFEGSMVLQGFTPRLSLRTRF